MVIIDGTTGVDLGHTPINNSTNVEVEGLLGIGTSTPGERLHIVGTSGSSSSTVLRTENALSYSVFGQDVSGNGYAWSPNSASMLLGTSKSTGFTSIYSGGSERLRIDASGNVGIGVTPSAWVSGWKAIELNGVGNSIYSAGQGSLRLGANLYRDSAGYKYAANGYSSEYKQESGYHQWLGSGSGTTGGTITFTNAMTLDNNSQLKLEGSNASIITNANLASIASFIQCNNASNGNYTFIQAHSTSDTNLVFESRIGATRKSAIFSNGTFQSATNSYGSTSDAKLKENVVDTSPKLDKLMKVQVRNFNYIGQEDKQIGVIAQEIEQIFPGVVFETKDTKQVEVEQEDGTVKTETVETGEVTKNVKYSVIYMMMLKGLQEMEAKYTAKISELEAKIAILEGAIL